MQKVVLIQLFLSYSLVFRELVEETERQSISFYKRLTPEEKKEIKRQRRINNNRVRSRNQWVDQFLPEEEGGDDFADLEDWIVVTESGPQRCRFRERESTNNDSLL